MAWYVWAILGLLVLSYCQYTSAEKTNKMLDPAWGKLHDFLTQQQGKLTGQAVNAAEKSACSGVVEPVCAEGKTYDNSCLAAADGKLKMTMGACA